MMANRQLKTILDHLILITGGLVMTAPVLLAFTTSTHDNSTISRDGLQVLPGGEFVSVYGSLLNDLPASFHSISAPGMLANSLLLALSLGIGKCLFAVLSAYALVYFRARFAGVIFWMIFATLLLPIETRILPTYLVVNDLNMLSSYPGLVLPLLPAAVGTLFFLQFFKGVPDELTEAARLDGAGPIKFLVDILIPVSRPMLAALFLITFVEGWNQYLWPLMLSTTDEGYITIVRGIGLVGSASNQGMALAMLALAPPAILVISLQRLLVKGLVDGGQ